MYRDNSLMPSEAIRLLALGLLADKERSYATLASEIRHFTGRLVGPSLDLVAQPLELLKLEGLITSNEASGMSEEALLQITQAGREELHKLLTSNLRALVNDLNKLIVAIKMRFLHHLAPSERQEQLYLLVEIFERELARLMDLRANLPDHNSLLDDWLELEISQTQARLTWFEKLAEHS